MTEPERRKGHPSMGSLLTSQRQPGLHRSKAKPETPSGSPPGWVIPTAFPGMLEETEAEAQQPGLQVTLSRAA